METARTSLIARGQRLAFPIPDGLMALVLAGAASIDFLPVSMVGMIPIGIVQARGELVFALMIEAGFLMMQGTLIDIATRLRKRPPVWAVVLIFGAVLLFSGEARGVLAMAWHRGGAVFVPLLVSLGERAAVLWRLPDRPQIEKIAARALIGNRITTGLALFGLMTAVMIAGVIFRDHFDMLNRDWLFLAAGSIYFAVAAFDQWRVRGAKFAEKPTVLFRFDPIGMKYLAPL